MTIVTIIIIAATSILSFATISQMFGKKLGVISMILTPMLIGLLIFLESFLGASGILLLACPAIFFAVKDCLYGE
jgi:hypothetical protein